MGAVGRGHGAVGRCHPLVPLLGRLLRRLYTYLHPLARHNIHGQVGQSILQACYVQLLACRDYGRWDWPRQDTRAGYFHARCYRNNRGQR